MTENMRNTVSDIWKNLQESAIQKVIYIRLIIALYFHSNGKISLCLIWYLISFKFSRPELGFENYEIGKNLRKRQGVDDYFAIEAWECGHFGCV